MTTCTVSLLDVLGNIIGSVSTSAASGSWHSKIILIAECKKNQELNKNGYKLGEKRWKEGMKILASVHLNSTQIILL